MVRGYDVKLRHFARHSRKQSKGALQTTDRKQNCLGMNCVEGIFTNCLRQKLNEILYDTKLD